MHIYILDFKKHRDKMASHSILGTDSIVVLLSFEISKLFVDSGYFSAITFS